MSILSHRLRRWRAVARIEVLHLIRDRPLLTLIAAVPAAQILLFGYAVRFEPRNVPIAIAREHAQPQGTLIHAIDATGSFRIVADGLPAGAAVGLVAQHRALVGIEYPTTTATDEADPASVLALIDATDAQTVRPAVLSMQAALLERTSGHPATTPLVHVTWLYNPHGLATWAITPALSGVIVMITMLLMGALTVTRERERGTWEGILATPASGIDTLIGKLSPHLIIGIVQGTVVIGVARGLFGLPFRGHYLVFLGAVGLLALAYLVLGFGLSALARTQLQAIQATLAVYLPSILLSGFLFPFAAMPDWAQWLAEALPLTHFVRASRGLLLRGDSAANVALEMWPVLVFVCVAGLLAVRAQRRHMN